MKHPFKLTLVAIGISTGLILALTTNYFSTITTVSLSIAQLGIVVYMGYLLIKQRRDSIKWFKEAFEDQDLIEREKDLIIESEEWREEQAKKHVEMSVAI